MTLNVQSADGTPIAYEISGDGAPLILVDPAGCYRELGPMRPLAKLLAPHFTVLTYDRRGRGESGDTPPYAVEREVEDLDALIAQLGGSAFLYAVSSGGLLALHAAIAGLDIPKMALFEPPIGDDEEPAGVSDYTRELTAIVESGDRRGAVEHFHRSAGVPDEILAQMGPTMPLWESVAHTLVYDCIISDATGLKTAREVQTPTLVIDSGGSSEDLAGWADAIVEALPNASHLSLPGEWHMVADEDIAAALVEFF